MSDSCNVWSLCGSVSAFCGLLWFLYIFTLSCILIWLWLLIHHCFSNIIYGIPQWLNWISFPPKRLCVSFCQGLRCCSLWDHHKINSKIEGFLTYSENGELRSKCAWMPVVNTNDSPVKFLLISLLVLCLLPSIFMLYWYLLIAGTCNILQGIALWLLDPPCPLR